MSLDATAIAVVSGVRPRVVSEVCLRHVADRVEPSAWTGGCENGLDG
ncbi:hypothetical protein [Austwickia chelonae]|nr:hypothetical protein [Austwickia chelonae]